VKDCKNCEHFDGYDNSDGTPYCTYEDADGDTGYEVCPFNDTAPTEEKGMTCTVDLGQINEYIANTISNSIGSRINVKIDSMLDAMVKKSYDEVIRAKTVAAIDTRIHEQIDAYMNGEITIGGGWGEKERVLTRTEYLSETINKELKDKFKTDTVKETVVASVRAEINDRTEKLKKEINCGIKNTFDEVTRKTLSESVVNMLMCSDTYAKLQNGMNALLK